MTADFQVPISSLPAWDKNPRQIDDDNLQRLARSIREYTATMKGWKIKNGFRLVDPIIFNARLKHVTGGHQRLQALEKILHQAWVHKDDIRIIDADPVTDAAMNIALNNPNLQGRWDLELLQADLDFIILETDNDLEELTVPGLDLESTGFTQDEYLELLPQDLGVEEDTPPAPPAKPRTGKGQVYRLGPHRVMCGDATSEADMRILMKGQLADMVFTDPPYGIDYQSTQLAGWKKGKPCRTKRWRPIENDNLADNKAFCTSFLNTLLKFSKDTASFYICYASKTLHELRAALIGLGIYFAVDIIWAKTHPTLTWARYHPQHEIIVYAGEGAKPTGKKSRWYGPKNESTLWSIPQISINDNVHPTQKPIALCARAIRNSSRPGELVLDVFGGSGSTLIAAEQLGRVAYIMEIDPRYVDVIVERYRNFKKRATK
jgi:DNA modification methylase